MQIFTFWQNLKGDEASESLEVKEFWNPDNTKRSTF